MSGACERLNFEPVHLMAGATQDVQGLTVCALKFIRRFHTCEARTSQITDCTHPRRRSESCAWPTKVEISER